jgi:hypothetical protein
MTVEERWLRASLKLNLLGLASLERTIARQRARVAGVKDGDASSLFYCIMASSRRQRNHVAVLRSGDRTATDLASKLPFWKARLMSREGRLVYVQAVMTAFVVF